VQREYNVVVTVSKLHWPMKVYHLYLSEGGHLLINNLKLKKMKSKITSEYKRFSDANLLKFARQVVSSLKDNAQFPTLKDSVTAVEQAVNDYEAALINAKGGDRTMISIKNDKKASLRILLAELSINVSQVCKGDRSMLLSSGFNISKDRSSATKLPFMLGVDLGQSGEATTRVPRIRLTRAYIHQYTTDPVTPSSAWRSETSKNNRYTFTGLSSGAKLWFRVLILDKDGELTYLEPVSRVVQ
jgi:hypothetical protein